MSLQWRWSLHGCGTRLQVRVLRCLRGMLAHNQMSFESTSISTLNKEAKPTGLRRASCGSAEQGRARQARCCLEHIPSSLCCQAQRRSCWRRTALHRYKRTTTRRRGTDSCVSTKQRRLTWLHELFTERLGLRSELPDWVVASKPVAIRRKEPGRALREQRWRRRSPRFLPIYQHPSAVTTW